MQTADAKGKKTGYKTLKVREDLYHRVMAIQNAHYKAFTRKISVTQLLEMALESLATQKDAKPFMRDEKVRAGERKG